MRLREELERAIGVAAKVGFFRDVCLACQSHKTAEKCMRLLKKKQRVQAERGRRIQKVGTFLNISLFSFKSALTLQWTTWQARPLIFLVSWANAQELADASEILLRSFSAL